MTSRHRHLRRCRPTLRRHKRPSTRVGFRHRRHYHPLLLSLLYTVYSPECHPSRRTSSNRRTVSSNDIASPTWSLRLHSVTSHALPLPISVYCCHIRSKDVVRGKSKEQAAWSGVRPCVWSRVGIVGGLGGWTPSSCLQTLIFEWKSAKNFNPWAKFQTFRQLTPQFF